MIDNITEKTKFGIDYKTKRGIAGWCMNAQKKIKEIRCFQGKQLIGYSDKNIDRPDVQSHYPNNPFSLHSGFKIQVDSHHVIPQLKCFLEFQFEDQSVEKTHDFILDAEVEKKLLLPEELGFGDDDPMDYLRYINTMWNIFTFIEKFFPNYNSSVKPGSKDEYCIASNPYEMLHIANHLYRLKRLGYTGGGVVCEFGCFKGFSTSCLSHACHYLGLKLSVFDSFAGLPEVDSNYYNAGDFCGTLDEVTQNVNRFGRIENVNFNKGFFCDSLKNIAINPMMIWMDVDLQSSSRDAMQILKQMPSQGCVMSHECFARNFNENSIKPDGDEGDVITPIIEAMNSMDRKIKGMWLVGGLGAFWDENHGISPISHDILNKVINLIK